MDILPICVEVVDQEALNENELAEFVETEPMQLGENQQIVGTKILEVKDEEELIKQLLDGKLSFTDYKYQVLDSQEGSDEEEEDDEEKVKREQPSSSTKFESELTTSRRENLRGQVSKVATSKEGKKKKSILPAALQGLMGEANLRYARGDNKTAEKICLEIIRQVPLAVEPFQTLAQIYEGADPEKSMQFMFIAGHLNPSDVDHWIRLAELSEEAGNHKQATMCYTKAVKAAPYDIDIRLRRIQSAVRMGDEKVALRYRLYMIRYIQDPAFQMETVKEVAQKYHELGLPESSLMAFRAAHKANGEFFSVDDVNQYLELLIDAKMYGEALNVLCQHTKIDIRVTAKTDQEAHSVDHVELPRDLIPDFRTKACICLIHLKYAHLYDHLVADALATLNVEEAGDCLLDIAEALMLELCYEEALLLLEPLVQSEKFSVAAVYLRYADCLRILGDIDRAIESYRTVVSLVPQHLDARLTLSALLKQKNQHAEALKALEQDLESDVLDPTLLYEHCYMLKETGNIEQYIDLSGVLFSRHCIRFRSREEVELGLNNRRLFNSWNNLKEYREFRMEDCEDTEGPEFVKSTDEPDKETEWELFVDVVKQCYYTNRFATMQKYTHAAMTSKRFLKYRGDIQFMALVACMANKDFQFGAFHAKELLIRNPGNCRAWNLFIANLQTPTAVKYNRSLQRFVLKEADKVEKGALEWKASYSLAAGSYQLAIRDFSNIFKNTKAPFAALLTAVALTHLAVQKFAHYKADLINQAIVFIAEYAKLREPEALQEVYYNTGRLYQQIGLSVHAAEYYKKVLACESHPDPKVAEIIDLKMEAAFNLHLIYKESGNLVLAKKYLYEYIVI